MLREVWIGNTNFNTIRNFPRAVDNIITHDRMYLDQPDFGEDTYFGHRFSGFFVPPKSSLYTFNILSDDQSSIIFYPNASTQLSTFTQYTANR